MIVLLNSFSMKMLPEEVFSVHEPIEGIDGPEDWTTFPDVQILIKKLPEDWVRDMLEMELEHGDLVSAIGHAATASVLSERLGVPIPAERRDVRLNRETGDTFIVAQVELPRLAEGQVLTEDQVEAAPITFYQVMVLS